MYLHRMKMKAGAYAASKIGAPIPLRTDHGLASSELSVWFVLFFPLIL